jgi:hypothetical protein
MKKILLIVLILLISGCASNQYIYHTITDVEVDKIAQLKNQYQRAVGYVEAKRESFTSTEWEALTAAHEQFYAFLNEVEIVVRARLITPEKVGQLQRMANVAYNDMYGIISNSLTKFNNQELKTLIDFHTSANVLNYTASVYQRNPTEQTLNSVFNHMDDFILLANKIIPLFASII